MDFPYLWATTGEINRIKLFPIQNGAYTSITQYKYLDTKFLKHLFTDGYAFYLSLYEPS